MNELTSVSHEFVHHIPPGNQIENGVVYVSIPFATAVHLCCCGCGNEVVTPLDPCQWRLTFDGKSVSLSPSVGNWGFPCQSHYWITRDSVMWVPKWSESTTTKAGPVGILNRQNGNGSEAPKCGIPTRSMATCRGLVSRMLGRWLKS